jgi:hypothetical protein
MNEMDENKLPFDDFKKLVAQIFFSKRTMFLKEQGLKLP